MSANAALRYYLPKTVLTVAADVRYLVVVDSAGGHLEPRLEVRVVPRVVADRSARCSTTLDAGVLDGGSFGVRLTPDGLIDALGSCLPPVSAPGTASPTGTNGGGGNGAGLPSAGLSGVGLSGSGLSGVGLSGVGLHGGRASSRSGLPASGPDGERVDPAAPVDVAARGDGGGGVNVAARGDGGGRVNVGGRVKVGGRANVAARLDLTDRTTWTRPGSLRAAFDRTHPRTAAIIADLSARAEQFLAGMRMGDGPAEVETFGSALAVVERELAAADRLRREWVAAQGFQLRSGQWDVDLADAVAVREPLPERLPADTPVPEGALSVLARDFGLLLAVHDPQRRQHGTRASGEPEGYDRVDELLLRQARPVTVAAYRRVPVGLGGGAQAETETVPGEWVRDDELTQHVEAIDAGSPVDVVAPRASSGGDRAPQLSFYPNGRVRTFGLSAVAPAAAAALPFGFAGLGGLAGPAGPVGSAGSDGSDGSGEDPAAADVGVSRSAVAAAALEAARLQLALLQATDEYTRLAAAHAHGGELANLEQDARFAALRSRRG